MKKNRAKRKWAASKLRHAGDWLSASAYYLRQIDEPEAKMFLQIAEQYEKQARDFHRRVEYWANTHKRKA